MKMLMFDFRDSEIDFFEKNQLPDFEITFFREPLNPKTSLSETQLLETDIISVFTTSMLGEEVLSKFRNLRVILTRSTGYNHIDLQYCIDHNIAVFNVEDFGQISVAQFAIALMLMLIRNILPAAIDMKNCQINHSNYEGRALNALTIGIIGCGAIGSAVAKIAHFFGMKVLIYSYMKNPEVVDFCEHVTLDDLLKNSDIITLHTPYTGDNYHMIGKHQFDIMKDGVFIINTARGELIDTEALYDNLISGKVKGAGLDVMECEFAYSCNEKFKTGQNNVEDCFTTSELAEKLFALKNVIITPHIAYNTIESVNYILETSFNSIKDFIKGNISNNRVC